METPVTASRKTVKLPDGISESALSTQLERILSSAVFENSGRLSRFLRYSVECALQGQSQQLKEYALALSVFDKPESFDPRFDPIVRVEAGRLRARLRQYYETAGLEDLIIIELPKGSYVPRFSPPGPPAPAPTSLNTRPEQVYSPNWIAVLPFADHSPERDQEYFCDGMTEELINALTKVRGLRVAAWTSAIPLRGETHDFATIASRLKVGTVVVGSVRKSGSRLRITAQLIGTADGCYLWSETYDRQIEDVFAIQEEISQAIVAMLKVQIADGQSKHLVRRYTENVEAYTLYLKGRYWWNRRSEQGLRKAIEYFEQAIALDPRYAPAYSGLADSYSLLGNSGAVPARKVKVKAISAALKAVELDGTLAEAHTALGHVRATYCWDWPSAYSEYRTAIALNPSYATVHHWYAITYLAPLALFENALSEIERAEELDPVSVSIKRDIAVILYYARRNEHAVQQCRRTIGLEPEFFSSYWALGLALESLSEYSEAIAAFEQGLKLAPGNSRLLGALGHAYARWGRTSEAQKTLKQMGELSASTYVSPFHFALVHLGLDERDEMFVRLEQAYRVRSYELVSLRVDPRFDSVRSDFRFSKLLARLGLENPFTIAV